MSHGHADFLLFFGTILDDYFIFAGRINLSLIRNLPELIAIGVMVRTMSRPPRGRTADCGDRRAQRQ
jgi:hypothetical protein